MSFDLKTVLKRIANFSFRRYPSAPALTEKHLHNCQLLPSREAMLPLLKKNSVCMEIGVLHGDFSRLILEQCTPSELHLVDVSTDCFMNRFSEQIRNKTVIVREGISWDVLDSYPDDHFDWIYIDASHDYDSVYRDVKIASKKIKADGMLIFNDYQYLCPNSYRKYGVIEVVNEFCLREDWEFVYFCLQGRGFYDVAIRKIVGA